MVRPRGNTTWFYHGNTMWYKILWFTMVNHGIPLCTMVGIPWYTMVNHGKPWYVRDVLRHGGTMVHHG